MPAPASTAPDRATDYRLDTPWGVATISATGPHVTRLRPPLVESPDQKTATSTHDAPGAVRDLGRSLCAYLAGDEVELAPHWAVEQWLEAAGVAGFRRDVSLALLGVPRGMTISYGQLAALAGRPGAARAVGTACARNPLPIIVPCHRVVHSGARAGEVGSYGAATGSDYKRRLLQLERAALVAGS